MGSADVPIQPAATTACLRDAGRGVEVLLVRRNSTLVFHGGAWVFPGGRVDEGDIPGELGEPDAIRSEAAARRAAVREASEEASIDLGARELVPLSHWTTPPGRPRRFSTWFFLADAQVGHVEVDAEEIDAYWWASPDEALRRRDHGEIELPPATFVTLTWLATLPSVRSTLEAAGRRHFERFVPRPVAVSGGVVALYAGDAGYESHDPGLKGARHRLWMLRDGWRYERRFER